MKTDQEIIDFIDSREVLTRNELSKFIYGYKNTSLTKVKRFWLYAIETKDLAKLKQHAYDKETHKDRTDLILERVKSIYTTDSRFNNIGGKSAYKLFKKLYGIDCNMRTFQRYHAKVQNV